MKYLSPLNVYIISHLEDDLSETFSSHFFRKLCRDESRPFDHRLGIPVFFRLANYIDGIPQEIDFSQAEKNAVICLIDTNLVLDSELKNFVSEVSSSCENSPDNIFIPVALSKSAYNIDEGIKKRNFIKADDDHFLNSKFKYIYHCVLHELCKLMIGAEKENKVQLFISHSKHDEIVEEAKSFSDYISKNTQLKTFFDANDIPYGTDFAKVLERNSKNSVIIAFLSDTYASREWCRKEIIIAKENHCPLIIVNAINTGENRSFPYLGNTPTMRWNKDYQSLADLALEVTLGSDFVQASLAKQAEFYGVEYDFILSNFPELFSIVGIKEQLEEQKKPAGIIMYPDPPLGNEELRILNRMDERLMFITPLQLSTFLTHG
ncbi:MAG: toll/interleukin-1 receptor domain-containing protein [Bacteroidota bacterium]